MNKTSPFTALFTLAFIFILFLSLYGEETTVSAEGTEQGSAIDSDTGRKKFITEFNENYLIRIFINKPLLNLFIKYHPEEGEEDNSKPVKYSPNVFSNGGISFDYKGIGISLGRTLKNSEKEKETYGKTEYRDFQFYYYAGSFGVDLYSQDYSGFYLKDPGNFGYTRGDPETIRSDLKIRTFGLNIYYIFDDAFSFRAAVSQSERQKDSHGSLLAMFSITRFQFESDYSLIPASQEVYYQEFSGLRKGRFTSMSLSPGYAYTFVFNVKYYLTLGAFLGGGIMKKEYTTGSGEIKTWAMSGKGNLRTGAGCNSERYFYGLILAGDYTATRRWWGKNQENTNVRAEVITLELFSGWRF
jgi:hypothetical protein